MAFIQTANSGTPSGTATSKTATFTLAQTAGNLNIIGISFGIVSGATVTVPSITVTDTAGNTYTAVGPYKQHPAGGGADGTIVYYAGNIAAAGAGANVVTVTLSTALSFFIVAVFEYSGMVPTSVLDVYVSNALPVSVGSSPVNVTSGPVTTTSPNELLFGLSEMGDVPNSVGVDYTQRMLQYTLIAGDKSVASPGIYSFTSTSKGTTAGWSTWLVAFRQSGTVPVPPSTFVQKANSGTPSGTAVTKSVTLNAQAAGNMNFVYLAFGNPTAALPPTSVVVSVTDDLNNSYLPAGTAIYYDFSGNTSMLGQTFYRPAIPGGNRTITATLSTAASFFILGVAEYNITTSAPFICASSFYGSSTTSGGNASGTATSGNLYADSGATVIGFMAASQGITSPGAGYAVRDQIYTLMVEDQQIVSSGVYNASATVGGTRGWFAQVCAFSVSGSPSVGSGEVLLNNPFTASSGNATALGDGNSWTFWTGAGSGPQSAQINAGAPCLLKRIRFSCYAGGNDSMGGCTISGCTEPSFTVGTVTTLYTIPSTRLISGDLMNEAIINAQTPCQYYRFNTLNFASALEDIDFYVTPVPGCVFQPGDITLSPCTGNYDLPTYLTLACPLTTSAVIRYTTDGTSPTFASPTYTGPFIQSTSATVQAIAFSPASATGSRILSRPVHIGITEISTDILYDDRNYRIWALNGSLWFDPKTKYWYRTGSNFDTPQIYTYGFVGNNVYRSPDLRNWEYRSAIQQPPPGQMDGSTNIRWSVAAKTLYNALTDTYVCWSDDYTGISGHFNGLGKTCWTSPNPEGPYTLLQTFTTIGPISGSTSAGQNTQGDFSLFLDIDGVTAYLVGTCASTGGQYINDTMTICKLTPSFTGIAEVTAALWSSIPGLPFTPKTVESTWITYYNGTYFMMGSPTTGWAANQNFYVSAPSPTGPWSGYTVPFLPVPGGLPDYTKSYDGQGWNIITLPGRNGGYIWHADRHDIQNTTGGGLVGGDFALSRRLRLPVIFSNTSASYTIPWNAAWSFDSAMPSVSGAPRAPSFFVLQAGGTSASWINNEPGPVKLYIDQARDIGFTQIFSSSALPDRSTTVSGLPQPPPGTYQRIRAVNFAGSSTSNVANRDNVIPGAGIYPPFMPVSFPPSPPAVRAVEDGPSVFLNPSNTGSPVRYTGQSQYAVIDIANPKPPRNTSPGAADKTLSQIPKG